MDTRLYTYKGKLWKPSRTTPDKNSFFHSAFGKSAHEGDEYYDPEATLRRRRWATFLTEFETKPISPALADNLTKCFSAHENYRNVSIEDKTRFKDYTSDIITAELDIVIEDVPILATLENIRIAVLAPDLVIEAKPDFGILGEYSVSQKFNGEVVLLLEGHVFTRLDPVKENLNMNETAEDNQKWTTSHAYKKGGDAGSKGVGFQVSLLTVCLLNGLRTRQNWRLSTENKAAGKFDDVVLEISSGDTLLQAKHRQSRSKTITFQELMSTNPKNDNFSLAKYFISYQEIKGRFNIGNLVICTNVKFDKNVSEYLNSHRISPVSLMYHADDAYTFHTFNDKILSHLEGNVKSYYEKNIGISDERVTDEDLKEFLNHLQFYSGYASGQYLRKVTEDLLVLVERPRDLRSQIYDKVMDWFQQENGVYWTEIHAKAKFLELQRDRYWKKLKKYKAFFKNDDLNFQDSTRIYNVVSKGGLLLRELKINQALRSNQTKTLYGNVEDGLEVLQAFELPDYIFLIIICSNPLTEEMKDKLEVILKRSEFKKVILVTSDKNHLFEPQELSGALIDKVVAFHDLLGTSKVRLLSSSRISFQGKTVTLKELFATEATKSYEDLLKEEIMEKLIKKEEVKVGMPNSDLEKGFTDFYINRKFKRRITENKVNVTDEIVYEETIYQVTEKMVIISDCAGMGKSTVLTKLTQIVKAKHPQMWVIRIDLNGYTKILMDCLEENRETITMLELLDSKVSTRITNQFEKELFLWEGKIVLMLDGVDEICPRYENLVLGLLVECQKAPNYAKIIVTTRPHMARKLEETLQVKAFSMQPFTHLNQTDFLVRYWMHNLKAEDSKKGRCERYAQALIAKMTSWIRSEENHFAAIPLHVRMLADIFQKRLQKATDWEGCSEYLNESDSEPQLLEIPNVKSLYDKFIANKRDLFVYKGTPTGNPTAYDALIKQFNACLAYHSRPALEVILDKSRLSLFPASHHEGQDAEQLSKIGIMQRIDDKFHFLHRTFAEYFTAQSLLEELTTRNVEIQRFLLDEVLVNSEFYGTRVFFDSFLQEVVSDLPSNTFEDYQSQTYPENSTNGEKLLHVLARDGCVAIVQLILNCIDLEKEDEQLVNTLNELQRVVKRDGLDNKDEDSNTPLHHATQQNQMGMVKFLVNQGANIASRNEKGYLALHIAAERGHLNLLKFFLKSNVNVLTPTKNKQTVLHLAARECNLGIVDFLLKTGVEVNVRDDDGRTALHFAAERGGLKVTKSLLQAGADVNVRDKEGRDVLHLAADWCQLETINFLAGLGMDINSKDNCGRTPVHLAASRGHLDSIIYLLKFDADIKSRDDNGRTPLHSAAEWGASDVVKLLAELGTDVNAIDNKRTTAMHLAAADGAVHTVEFLAKFGADASLKDESGKTALHLAISRGHFNMVKFLFEVSNIEHKDVNVALQLAAPLGHLDMVEFFVERGAYIHFSDGNLRTILHLAASRGQLDVVKFLVRRGAHPGLRDNDGGTALHLAAAEGHLDVVEFLVGRGARTHITDKKHRTPLYLAASHGHLDVVKFLVEKDPISFRRFDFYSVLNAAASRRHSEVVEFLVGRGAS